MEGFPTVNLHKNKQDRDNVSYVVGTVKAAHSSNSNPFRGLIF